MWWCEATFRMSHDHDRWGACVRPSGEDSKAGQLSPCQYLHRVVEQGGRASGAPNQDTRVVRMKSICCAFIGRAATSQSQNCISNSRIDRIRGPSILNLAQSNAYVSLVLLSILQHEYLFVFGESNFNFLNTSVEADFIGPGKWPRSLFFLYI